MVHEASWPEHHLGLSLQGQMRRHTVLHTASRSAGLPHTYSAGVTSAFRRAMMANKLVASFLNLRPPLVNCLTIILTNEGHQRAKKQITTNTMMRSDSFLLSLSALGGSLLRWFLAMMYNLTVISTLTKTIICKLITPNAFIWAALEMGTMFCTMRIVYV